MQVGQTALHEAAQYGHANTVKVLLEKAGAQVNVIDQVTRQ